jgi:predicted permease
MKKYVVSLLAVLVAIAASSFTTGIIRTSSAKKEVSVVGSSKWYNFNGVGLLDMCDPGNYSLDENNFPDCPPTVGLVYCEIYAQPSLDGDGEPDLSTITNYRMRPIL